MARGRRKPRSSRMDAAFDAMLPFGFTKEQVRKQVKELLKVYGGDEGWRFIEESAYQLLIDTLLPDVERDDLEQVVQDGNQMKDKPRDDEEPDGASNRASGVQQDEGSQDNAPADIRAVAESTCSEFVSSLSVITNAEADAEGWKDILQDQTSEPPLKKIPTPQPMNSRRRFPCYGWIDSDEDDHDDFILLEPASGMLVSNATLTHELSKCLSGMKRKRKSRWDEKPDDP